LNQHQLAVGIGIDPQFDCLAQLAEFDQSNTVSADCTATAPVEKNAANKEPQDPVPAYAWPRAPQARHPAAAAPNKLEAKRNHDLGGISLHESTRSRIVRRQDQARHVCLRTADGKPHFKEITG
jgi:hypothetical protein